MAGWYGQKVIPSVFARTIPPVVSYQEVVTLVDGRQEAGAHAVAFQGSNLPSGTYFYRIDINGAVRQVRRLTLLK